jgi:energy-coupling factor transporter ATP-binding protein EcfA2
MADYLNVRIEKLRGIEDLKIDLNLTPGIYAIAGQNASGKSTLMASLASIFYKDIANKYFANSTQQQTKISVALDRKTLEISPNLPNSRWRYNYNSRFSNEKLKINGFYEGSIIYGNRFRDTNPRALFEATKIIFEDLEPAADFVWENLGHILHDNRNYYKGKLFRILSTRAYRNYRFNGSPYFIVLEDGKIISQFSLSTGENLMVSVLHSIQYQLKKSSAYRELYLVLLDEIELALHPSALNRLIKFLNGLAIDRHLAVYFSTHSVELIRQIPSENIYFLRKHLNNVVEVQNPVSPAYATRAIYIHDGYDLLILVEDNLAKCLVDWIIRKEDLNKKRLIHILPAGGWENVLALNQDIVSSYILKQGQKAISILDGDIQGEYKTKYVDKGLHGNLNVFFTPIKSAEKYLRDKLVDNVNFDFYNSFGDNFFKRKTLDSLLNEYKEVGGIINDKNGKRLLNILKNELVAIGQSEKEFYTYLTEYIVEEEKQFMINLVDRLKRIIK